MPTPTPVPTPTPAPAAPVRAAASTSRIVGYFAGWKIAEGFNPYQIDVSKLTHINYAFAKISSDNTLIMGYPKYDPQNFAALRQLKKQKPELKTLIAVGGWDWSERFSDAALTEESRKTFAESCVAFMIEHGFDGVDLDWEYPVQGGASDNVRRPEDRENFTLLMKTLRQKLDERSAADGKPYLLTFAGGCYTTYIKNTQLDELGEIVDFANLMTYDMHGTWDVRTDFNAPLYPPDRSALEQLNWSVDKTVNLWLNAGMPAEKIVLGIPFYGMKYTNVTSSDQNGWYQTYSGGWAISYKDIAEKYLTNPTYKRYFHPQAKVPWLFDGSTFISYDDPESIGWKANYIRDRGLGGAMFWQITQDNGTLLNALEDAMDG